MDSHIYQQIVESIRQDILLGTLKPGDRLPAIRKMRAQWQCNSGTILRAYQELARMGLITSHVGQGTKVSDALPDNMQNPLRRAALFNKAEAFLLEVMTAGYTPEEIEKSLHVALDRWRVFSLETEQAHPGILNFIGSHDLALALIASQFNESYPEFSIHLSFAGSLGGLIALAQNKADLAGCHLWDETTDTYNESFIRKLLPGQKVMLLTLAHRRVGLIVASGNPLGINNLADIARPDIKFVNRQPGSGTRVWLDAQMKRLGIDPALIDGYENEKMTHSDVAQAISKGNATLGLGVESAALAFELGFQELTTERYDLAIPQKRVDETSVKALQDFLTLPTTKKTIHTLGGYDTSETGYIRWVE